MNGICRANCHEKSLLLLEIYLEIVYQFISLQCIDVFLHISVSYYFQDFSQFCNYGWLLLAYKINT